MTEKQLVNRLNAILKTLDSDRYPEIYDVIDEYLKHFYYRDVTDLASDIFYSDCTEVLPQDVVDLLKKIYQDEVNNGNYDYMTDLGALYYTGRGGEQDYVKAAEYYKLAAEHGEEQAFENLGYCYYYGRHDETDYEKAFKCFIRGALSNKVVSMYKIGDMYKNGYYVEKDERQAVRIYLDCYRALKEADEDYDYDSHDRHNPLADICLRIGNAYLYGRGIEQDYEQALSFFQQAEVWFYRKIKNGDFYSIKGLKATIENQEICRKAICETLPDFNWVNHNY